MRTFALEVILLPWTLLTPCLWSFGSGQILQPAVSILYPQLLSTQFIQCKCVNIACESVFWFRTIFNQNKVQFLGRSNNANRVVYGNSTEVSRFQLTKKNSEAFILQIINVTEEDTGIYSCILKDRKNEELWQPGFLLLPGVNLYVTERLPTKPPESTLQLNCSCTDTLAGDCDSLVLWSLGGLATVLVTTLVCSLYYFSRLPKKCQHHFVK
ncbi:uncharacterized protein cd8b [Phyllopteryx taeniolatus]|uniref:uncharacterized protein cd8b n=1 Tax=Phyllopteryx taeniolatus TaxID=161469 RepID=UPI002AD51604|nr:uncharacterized protein cd8b [Phyllopteryx taeniolatus]